MDPLASLTDLLNEAHGSTLVSAFLKSAFTALRAGIVCLPSSERELFSGRDFGELLENFRNKKTKHAAITTVLSCVSQLGWLLRHREVDAEAWLYPERLSILGVCTGSLAAIAATAARSDSDLLHFTPLFVSVALRLGIEVARRSAAIDSAIGSWSAALSGASLEAVTLELESFHRSKVST